MPVKPSTKEEEFIAREEFERMQKLEKERRIKMEAEEAEKLKNLHYMHCPKCGNNLIEISYRDILVDKCSACDGVWLDAGELEAVSTLEESAKSKWFSVFKK